MIIDFTNDGFSDWKWFLRWWWDIVKEKIFVLVEPFAARGTKLLLRPSGRLHATTMTRLKPFLQRVAALFCLVGSPPLVVAQQSINLHAKMSVNKNENTAALLADGEKLVAFGKESKLHGSILLFLDNMLDQLRKLDEASKTVKAEVKKEKAVSFTVGKYKLKEMKKLRAKETKKNKIPEMTVEAFEKKYGGSSKLEFTKPFLVKNGEKLFKNLAAAREMFTADKLSTNEYLEKKTQLEYFPPDQPRQKIVGNMVYMTEPALIPMSRYLTNCYLGTPAAPKIPGQATEHCEQTVSATKMVEDEGDLDVFTTYDCSTAEEINRLERVASNRSIS